MHLNTRSISSKLDYLESLAQGSSILCVTETHLEDTFTTNNLEISFIIKTPYRGRNSHRGGVLVYVTEDLHVIHRDDLEFQNRELIWLENCFPRYKILLCAFYRTQGTINPFGEHFQISLERALHYTSYVDITGDLNVNLL